MLPGMHFQIGLPSRPIVALIAGKPFQSLMHVVGVLPQLEELGSTIQALIAL